MVKETAQLSYERHAEHESYLQLASCYTDPDSIDAWHHERMIRFIVPLIQLYPDSKFLTVGDGRYGSDAFLLKKYQADVLATSLTDNYLKIAKEKGYIDKYQAVNAENMPFDDNYVDFVLCKESYHHFPRPAIAFYEMLRVAKVAIILIEPTDDHFGLIDFLKKPLKKILRKEKYTDYERSGNYIFRSNSREIKKMLLALNKPLYGVKYFNDFYLASLAKGRCENSSLSFLITRFANFAQDILCKFKFLNYGKAIIMAFKTQVPPKVIQALKKNGFKMTFLPKNPYL